MDRIKYGKRKVKQKMETSTKQNRVAFAILQTAIILLGLTVYAAGVVLFILPLDMIAA